MLENNSEKRPDTVKLLMDPIILKKIDELTNRDNFYGDHQDIEMLNTIKFSPSIAEMNKNLPKLKRYSYLSRSDNKLVTYKNNFEHPKDKLNNQ